MRYLVLVFALYVLSSCGGDVGGASPPLDSHSWPGTSDLAGEIVPVWDQYTWNLVKIMFTTIKGCDPMGPGAEIDAVEIVRDGAVIGYAAALVGVEPPLDAPCPEQRSPVGLDGQTLGPPDGAAPSLNGADLYLFLSTPLLTGDLLVIHELDPEGEVEEDCFRVYLGTRDDDGGMAFTDELVDSWKPTDASRGCETMEMAFDALW